jgi:hypothetical protein
VTSGALTFLVLAASLVTLSFLMAPVIERVFGMTNTLVVRPIAVASLPILYTSTAHFLLTNLTAKKAFSHHFTYLLFLQRPVSLRYHLP